MKRFVQKILLLSVVCLLSVVTASAYDFRRDGLCYNITSEEDRTVEVTQLSSSNAGYVSGDLTIPERIIYFSKAYRVTSIGESAFWGRSGLTSVVIPSSVTSIGGSAFYGCSGLTSVVIPSSVTSIGESAFSGCYGLTSVVIPSSVTSIGGAAFWGCSGLTSVVIPSSITSIGRRAFSGCSKLAEIVVDDGNQNYMSIDGILYSKDGSLLHSCPGAKTSVDIPSSVTSIGGSAFLLCSGLTSVVIPPSVTSIGESAFANCSGLTIVVIPSSVTSISSGAFYDCSNLKEVYCMMETPVATEATFSDDVLMNAVLYVPTGTKDEYEKVDPWRNFFNIEEFDATGISNATVGNDEPLVTIDGGTVTVNNNGTPVNVYTAGGQCVYSGTDGTVGNLAKGLYIIRWSNNVVKVVLK